MTDHYTAVIEVTHTQEAKTASAGRPSYEKALDEPRKKRDIARIVVRADSLNKLKERLVSHTELLEDDANQATGANA